jgi:hypothetical protein
MHLDMRNIYKISVENLKNQSILCNQNVNGSLKFQYDILGLILVSQDGV